MKLKRLLSFIKYNFWKIIVSIGAICLLAIAILFGIIFYRAGHWENNIQISENLGYRYNQDGGYIYNLKTNEKVIPDVDYVVTPNDNDSIAVFHWGEKRGYFNIKTGEIIAQPKYEAAWMFRSGIGAVALNDSVFFIGLDGKPISNTKVPRIKGEDYLFKGEYCIIKVGSKYGAIDKSGDWILQPEWDYIDIILPDILVPWVNKIPIFIYDKNDSTPYLKHIEIKSDTIVSYTDSIRIYVRDRDLE